MDNFHNADNGKIEKATGWNLFNSIQGAFQHTPSQEAKDLNKSILDSTGTIRKQSLEALTVVSEVCSKGAEDFSEYLLSEEIKMLTESFDFAF
jgi:hypothetical protein